MQGKKLIYRFFQTVDEPKWMKFFKGFQPIQFSLERSLKNENSDLLNNHVRANFKSFTLSQLFITIQKLNKPDIIQILQKRAFQVLLSQDLDEIQLNKNALMTLIETNKIPTRHSILLHLILIQTDNLFDSLSLEEQIVTFEFIIQNGFTSDALMGEICTKLKNANLTQLLENMNINQTSAALKILNYLPKEEGQFRALFEDKLASLIKNNPQQQFFIHQNYVRVQRSDLKQLIIDSMRKSLDPSLQGYCVPNEIYPDRMNDHITKTLLSKEIPPSERVFLQNLIILLGNGIKKQDSKIKKLVMKVQGKNLKFSTVSKHFAYQLLRDNESTQYSLDRAYDYTEKFNNLIEWFVLEKLFYFDQIGLKEMIQLDTQQNMKATYDLITYQNLSYLTHYMKKIQFDALLKQLHLVITEEPPLLMENYEEYAKALKDELAQDQPEDEPKIKIENFQIQKLIEEQMKRLTLGSQLKGFYQIAPPVQTWGFFVPLEKLISIVALTNSLLRNYPLDVVQVIISNDLWQSKTFSQCIEKFGMFPNLVEMLVEISIQFPLKNKLIDKIANKISQIFNQYSQNPQQLANYIEEQLEIHKAKVFSKSDYYQPQGFYQYFHSTVHSIAHEENYLLKIINSPILEKCLKVSPLKQVISSILPDWRMNYVIYPAMADFVNLKEKIAIFVIDQGRLQHGANNLTDYSTRQSENIFKLLSYKIVKLNYLNYSSEREKILHEIQKQIK